MSRHGAVELEFGGSNRTFRLSLDGILELEASRDLSYFEIARRLSPQVRDARLSDISEVLRIALIGGGMSPIDAKALTLRYCDQRPLDENRDVAYAIALIGMQRVSGDDLEQAADGDEDSEKKSHASTLPTS